MKVEGFGEIDLAFAFFEYEFAEFLKIRAGKYLNPFGLLLERRDAQPTYLLLFLPQLYRQHKFPLGNNKYISDRFMPPYNVGVQLRGEWNYIGYALQVANGRGAVANVIDKNQDKAIGVHVYAKAPWSRLFGSQIGADFYTDEKFDGTRLTTFAGHLILRVRKVGPGHITLLGEGALLQIPDKNINAFSWYGLLSYSIPVASWELAPYVVFDFLDRNTNMKDDEVQDIFGGLAVNPNPHLRIKLEVHRQTSGAESGFVFGAGISYAF